MTSKLRALERRIDAAVAESYALRAKCDEPKVEAEFDRRELARRWVSWAFRHVLAMNDGVARVSPVDRKVVGLLCDQIDSSSVDSIDYDVGGIGRFLAREFERWHVRLYRRRPVVWMFRSAAADRAYAVIHDYASAEVMRPLFRTLRCKPPKGWKRRVDQGILVNFPSVATCGVENSASHAT
jgi:hypothetical protein